MKHFLALGFQDPSADYTWIIIGIVLVLLFFVVVIVAVGLVIFFVMRKKKAQKAAAAAGALPRVSEPALSAPPAYTPAPAPAYSPEPAPSYSPEPAAAASELGVALDATPPAFEAPAAGRRNALGCC